MVVLGDVHDCNQAVPWELVCTFMLSVAVSLESINCVEFCESRLEEVLVTRFSLECTFFYGALNFQLGKF